ncbi:MAG TPA: stage V sporulation protein AD [Peptococcaceae bacterium]|nr:stage V sporulation protein AD [Peptococcaceae bacterium]
MAAPKKLGQQTVMFQNPPVIAATATIVGPKEGQGPLAHTFDKVVEDPYYAEKCWEKAERRMLEEVMQTVIKKAVLAPANIDYLLAGDLLNQIISAGFTARSLGIPFIGLYGACATMYEGLALGAILIDGGFADYVVVGASSHYSTAERQYRFPTEQGVQRPPTAQWTVTGAGAALLARTGAGPVVTHATIGKVLDLGQGDPNDFGSAMAPAAADTIVRHLQDTARGPQDFDLFLTGDLGIYGKGLADQLVRERGFDIGNKFADCGTMIYDHQKQDTHAGGSGCACAAVVTCGYLMQQMLTGKIKRVLGVATGALLSPLTTKQGETIPVIAHAVAIEMR